MRQALIEHCRKFMPVADKYEPVDKVPNTLYVSEEFPGKGFNVVYAYIDVAPGFNNHWLTQLQGSTNFLPGWRVKVRSVMASQYDHALVKPLVFEARPLH